MTNELKTTIKIICPYCGGDGKQSYSTFMKLMCPIFFCDPKYKCKNCKKLFNESHKSGEPFKKEEKKLSESIKRIAKAIVIILFLGIIQSCIEHSRL